MGLLLLRAAAGSVLVVQGITFYQEQQSLEPVILTISVCTVLAGVLLCAGLFTRFATAVAAVGTVGSMFSWLPAPRSGLFETHSTTVLGLAIAAAIASAGPGAFSIDARIFGRREIIVPKDHDHPRA